MYKNFYELATAINLAECRYANMIAEHFSTIYYNNLGMIGLVNPSIDI